MRPATAVLFPAPRRQPQAVPGEVRGDVRRTAAACPGGGRFQLGGDGEVWIVGGEREVSGAKLGLDGDHRKASVERAASERADPRVDRRSDERMHEPDGQVVLDEEQALRLGRSEERAEVRLREQRPKLRHGGRPERRDGLEQREEIGGSQVEPAVEDVPERIGQRCAR